MPHHETATTLMLDELDRRLIVATQEGLPLTPQPYHTIAQQLDTTPKEVMLRLEKMLQNGIIRRIGVVPNHYALGYTSNGMTVWNVPDECVDEMGALIGALPFVSHCYQRPRHLPGWPYNLFAMVHGRNKDETSSQMEQIASLLGPNDLGHTVLYSTRILKKTGLRLANTT